MFESVQALIDEHRAVQEELSDPAVHADAARAKRVNRRYAELSRIVAAHDVWAAASDDLEAARELGAEDSAFAAEIPALEEQVAAAQETIAASGALTRVEGLIDAYTQEADQALRGAPLAAGAVEELRALARDATARAS